MSDLWLSVMTAALNAAWQGALLAAAAWLALRWAIRLHAGVRHFAWLALFLAVLLLPLGGFLPRASLEFAAPEKAPGLTMEYATSSLYASPRLFAEYGLTDSSLALEPQRPATVEIEAAWAPWLLAAWAGMSVVLLVRLGRRIVALEQLKRSGGPPEIELAEAVAEWIEYLGPGRQARLLLSDDVEGPILAGLWQPAVVMPKQLASRLAPEEIQAIWMHEMAHLRRRDDWLELLEQLAVALFPVQPTLLFIKRQADQVREEACDAWVVKHTDDGLTYAECLLKLAEWRFTRNAATGLSIAEEARRIHRRIDMLLRDSGLFRPIISRTILSAFLLLVGAAVAMLLQAPPAIVFAQAVEEVSPTVTESPDVRPESPSSPVVPEVDIPPVRSADAAPQPPIPPTAPAGSADLLALPAPAAAPVPPRPGHSAPAPVAMLAAAPQPPNPPLPLAGAPLPHPQAEPGAPPAPAEPPAPEEQLDLRALSEEVALLAEQMKEIHVSKMVPLQVEVQMLAKQMAEQVQADIAPRQARIAEMSLQIAALAAQMEPTEAVRQRLEEQMRQMEVALRPAQEKIREAASAIRRNEEEMRKVERAMLRLEREIALLTQRHASKKIRQASQELREANKELRKQEKETRKESEKP